MLSPDFDDALAYASRLHRGQLRKGTTIPYVAHLLGVASIIRHIEKADASTRLVSASDKLHNARSILADLRTHGEGLWPRFTGGKDGSLWYYRGLVTAFRAAGGSDDMTRLVAELDRTVSEIEGGSR